MNFNTETDGNGLLPYYRDPATRGALVSFIERKVGRSDIAGAVVEAADRYNVDPALVIALMWQESKYNSEAIGQNRNGSTDRGLMQLNSSTFPDIETNRFFDPEVNVNLGTAYLRESLNRAGNTVAGLAMYNAGPNRVGLVGAPQSTLNYVHNITEYRMDLIAEYRESTVSGSVLMTRDIKPVKNPDIL